MRLLSHLAKPYIRRELPGWGTVYKHCIGDHRRDLDWRGHCATIIDKNTGYELDLDLGRWSDRMMYFLGRWYDLCAHLVIKEHVKSGHTIVDVGANRGAFALSVAHQLNGSGRIICFEPNPNCVATLRGAVQRNRLSNIDIRQVGLSDREEMLDLFIPHGDVGLGSFSAYGEVEETSLPCQLLIGDEALHGIAPNFIKIDVEGFEERVIRGLTHTLREHRPVIYMECVEHHLARAGSSINTIIGLMSNLSYSGRRVAYRGRHPTQCEYLPIDGRNCDVLWTANQK